MQRLQRGGERQAEVEALGGRQPPVGVELALQCLRMIANGIDDSTSHGVVGQFHDVVEETLSASDMEDIDEPIVRARDRLEGRHAVEFPLKRTLVGKGVAADHLYGAQRAGEPARQPDFAVSAPADGTQHFVVGNSRPAQSGVGHGTSRRFPAP